MRRCERWGRRSCGNADVTEMADGRRGRDAAKICECKVSALYMCEVFTCCVDGDAIFSSSRANSAGLCREQICAHDLYNGT